MTVAQFITAYMAEGHQSVSCTTAKDLRRKFKQVAFEEAASNGNDTLLALEFGITWQDVYDFYIKHKLKNQIA